MATEKASTFDADLPWIVNGMPTTMRIKVRAINPRWCAHNKGVQPGWTLTHRLTGRAAAFQLSSFATARTLALALDRAVGRKTWEFTRTKVGQRLARKARPIIEKYTFDEAAK